MFRDFETNQIFCIYYQRNYVAQNLLFNNANSYTYMYENITRGNDTQIVCFINTPLIMNVESVIAEIVSKEKLVGASEYI